jgi:hypothetical protein
MMLRISTSLVVDAMYYHAAKESHQRAVTQDAVISRNKEWVDRLREKEQELKQRQEEREEEGEQEEDALEEDALELEYEEEQLSIEFVDNAQPALEAAYSILVKEVALTHILCAACLEAHINARAEELLGGKLFEFFDRLNAEAKWLYLPLLSSRAGFDAGAEPFQGISRLVKTRNTLIHFRPRREDWRLGEIPKFIDGMQLRLSDAAASIDLVPRAVKRLSQLLAISEPEWVSSCPFGFFSFDIEQKTDGTRPA